MHELFLETKYATYQIEGGIMRVVFSPDLCISLEVAKELVEERLRFSKGKTFALLVDIRGLASVDNTSRKFFAEGKALELASAAALVGESLISKLAGNIFIAVDKPPLPIRLFTNTDKAYKWISKFAK